MRLAIPGSPHLTYCTNIHPGESWPDVRKSVAKSVAAVKARVLPEDAFGIGLRLSARAAEELAAGAEMDRFKEDLAARGLYVFTVNGFPYGAFHGRRVKEAVYRPDWLEPARVAYTDRLAGVLADLLPTDCPGLIGTISTVPLGFAKRVATGADRARCAEAILEHVMTLLRIEQRTGKTIALALEPEPGCALEAVDDTLSFFDEHLFGGSGLRTLVRWTGLSRGDAEAALRRHVGLCFDACHFALQPVEASEAVRRLTAAGVPIHKVQLSAGLRVVRGAMREEGMPALRQFSDSVYLHQTLAIGGGQPIAQFLDLPEAVEALQKRRDWDECRIHFHVPIFLERLGPFVNTQPYLSGLLDLIAAQPIAPHLEVETYTWDVLPEAFRTRHVEDSIARELRWVLDGIEHRIGRRPASADAVSPYA